MRSLQAVKILWKPSVKQWMMISIRRTLFLSLFEMAREINKLKTEDTEKANGLAARLRELAGILGLLQQDPEKFLQAGSDDDEVAKIEALIKQRNEARAAKDWAAADAARNELTAMGIVLEDGPNGTTWRKQ